MLVIKENHIAQTDASEIPLCLEELISKFNIDLEMKTDPQIIEEIVNQEILLDDCYAFRNRFGKQLSHPESLQPLLEKIISGLIKKHPAIVEFIGAAIDQNLLEGIENQQDDVKRIIHYIYLLDLLTKEMFDNWEFMVELRHHFLNKREELGIDSDFLPSFVDILKITGGLFFSAKTVTMDWVFQEYERIRRQGFIERQDILKRKMGLTLNILEAVITDKRKGFRNNALTGLALILTPPEDVILTEEKRTLDYVLSPQWTSLYETWNFAFISGNMDNLDLLYPKLLIPQVLNAVSDEYLFNRALSLWAAINFYLFRKTLNQSRPSWPNSEQIAQLWGNINYKYAQAYLKDNSEIELIGIESRKPIQPEEDLRAKNIKNRLLSRLHDIGQSSDFPIKKRIEEICSDLLET